MWRLERDSIPRPFGRKATNLPVSHHVPPCYIYIPAFNSGVSGCFVMLFNTVHCAEGGASNVCGEDEDCDSQWDLSGISLCSSIYDDTTCSKASLSRFPFSALPEFSSSWRRVSHSFIRRPRQRTRRMW